MGNFKGQRNEEAMTPFNSSNPPSEALCPGGWTGITFLYTATGCTPSLFPPDLALPGCVFRTQAAETSTPLGDAVTQKTEQGRRGCSPWGGATAARSWSRPMIGSYNGPALVYPRPLHRASCGGSPSVRGLPTQQTPAPRPAESPEVVAGSHLGGQG